MTIFVDAIPVNNGEFPNIYIVKAMLNNLDAKNERSKENFLFTLACFQERSDCDHSILKPLITLLQYFYYNDVKVDYYEYDDQLNPTLKSIKIRLIPLVWILDKASNWVLAMVSSQAYLSCWQCLIVGYKLGRENMFYPFYGKDNKVALRDPEWEKLCTEKAKIIKRHYGGTFIY